jgi:hypothetical protein
MPILAAWIQERRPDRAGTHGDAGPVAKTARDFLMTPLPDPEANHCTIKCAYLGEQYNE